MKALTLKHPWPFAVAFLGKDVENREWDDQLAERLGLPYRLGEQIAIHGGCVPKRGRNKAWKEFMGDLAVIRCLLDGQLPSQALTYLHDQAQSGPLLPEHFIMPGVVAVTALTHSTRNSRSEWAAPGQLHLLLSNTVALAEPVQVRGDRGFWELPEVIEEEVQRQMLAWSQHQIPPETGRNGASWLG